MNTKSILEFHTILNKERENLQHYKTILQNNWETSHTLMMLSINHNNIKLSLFMLENGFSLYDVVVFRKILLYGVIELIDKYLDLGIDLNDTRLYTPEIIEDYSYYSDSDSDSAGDSDSDSDSAGDSDSPNNVLYKEPKLVSWEMESPVLLHTNNIDTIKKFVEHGIDLNNNIYSSNKGGALKKAIDYGDMDIVEYYMGYLNKEHIENNEWWVRMLGYVSQNGSVGKGAEKCYNILCLREKLMGYPNRLPDRKIYDVVKHKWAYKVVEDPGKFRFD